jgi:hypothetical protein
VPRETTTKRYQSVKNHILINFSETADLGLAEYLFENSVAAVEAITSEETLKAHSGVNFSAEKRSIEIEVRGPAGEALRRCLLALIDLHFDEEEYRVADAKIVRSPKSVAVFVTIS